MPGYGNISGKATTEYGRTSHVQNIDRELEHKKEDNRHKEAMGRQRTIRERTHLVFMAIIVCILFCNDSIRLLLTTALNRVLKAIETSEYTPAAISISLLVIAGLVKRKQLAKLSIVSWLTRKPKQLSDK